MNITYIIGNGFDRNLGFKTAYSDFIKWYTEEKDKSKDDNTISWFKSKLENEKENWSDAELAFGQLTSALGLECDAPGVSFEKCYNDFVESFCIYLEKEQSRLNASVSTEMSQQFGTALKSYTKGLKKVDINFINDHYSKIGGGETYSIISFNYTNIIERLYNNFKANIVSLGFRDKNKGFKNVLMSPVAAHGNLKDGNIIFGVDNDCQISDVSVFDKCHKVVKDVFIKKTSDEINGDLVDKSANDLFQRSNLVYIYGCSLGDTDKTWWKRVIDILKEKTDLLVIIYSFELHNIRSLHTRLQKEQTIDKVKDDLLRHSDDKDDINNPELRSRIFVTGEDNFSLLATSFRNILSK